MSQGLASISIRVNVRGTKPWGLESVGDKEPASFRAGGTVGMLWRMRMQRRWNTEKGGVNPIPVLEYSLLPV